MSREIQYGEVASPKPDCTYKPVMLSDETMKQRYQKVVEKMRDENIDTLVIYGDVEHGNNFEYLTGFVPRFEEALLILHKDGSSYMVMGNENLNKVQHARIQAKAIHAPYFSLPNQPMGNPDDFIAIMKSAGIKENQRIGLVGWKNFTSSHEDNTLLFDIPSYIVDAIKHITGAQGSVVNATSLFIGEHGVRCINNVNELEHYEFGASLASDCMLKAMDRLDIGVSEMTLGSCLLSHGQTPSVVTIASAGKRFVKANLYPTDRKVALQDPISLTVGYKGGLSSRSGYAVYEESELPKEQQDYLNAVVKPYYSAVVAWLEQVHCGMTGNDVYEIVNKVLPKAEYRWTLCPGHLTADEEWLSSPIYEKSEEGIVSGMLFQIDIIPSVQGYAGTSAECTVAIADEQLREDIKTQAPDLWNRIRKRRDFIINELHIKLHPDILPMGSTVGYLRPFLLNKKKAMYVK